MKRNESLFEVSEHRPIWMSDSGTPCLNKTLVVKPKVVSFAAIIIPCLFAVSVDDVCGGADG